MSAPQYEDDDPQKTIQSLRTQLTIARNKLFEATKPEPSNTVWNTSSVDPQQGVLVAVICGLGQLSKAININGKWYRQDDEGNLIIIREVITHWAKLP